MKYIFNLLFLILGINTFSQIKLIISPLDRKCMDDCKIKVTLKNTTIDNYIIPLDTTSMKAYDNNEFWKSFVDSENVAKTLCLELYFKDSKTKKNLISLSKNRNIDFDLVNIDSLSKSVKKENNIYQKKLELWRKKYAIKNSSFSEKNMYLNNNLLFLEAGKELSFHVKFSASFDLVNSIMSMESYYIIVPGNKYYAEFKLNIPTEIRSYFTSRQLEKYRNYKIFTGKISSNSLSVTLEDNNYLLSD